MTKHESLKLVKRLWVEDEREHPGSSVKERIIRVLAAALVAKG